MVVERVSEYGSEWEAIYSIALTGRFRRTVGLEE
jgi:hypothetical protein